MQNQTELAEPAPSVATGENRCERRRRVLKAGLIFFNNGFSSYDCLIRNQHEGGYRVDLERPHLIPDEFMFIPDGDDSVPAIVVWRNTKSLGIKTLNA